MSQLTEIIKSEIALHGAISFARFMELALYCPEYGYYEKESDTVGRGGDFYTSVSVGSLFGELLAFQFANWLEGIATDKLQIVEAGAHDGKLAVDILRWLACRRPKLFERVDYVILDPSERREQWQRKRLADFMGKVSWLKRDQIEESGGLTGVIFANELLDAMPVHRMGWNSTAQRWFEWGITTEAHKLVWKRMQPTVTLAQLEAIPHELCHVLPDDFTVEFCPGAEKWWIHAAETLQKGWLMTLDYGLSEEEFFSPQRDQGTLRAYRRHRLISDLLADPGEQDLTAHVNFSQIQRSGEANGLRTDRFVTQAEFVVGIAKEYWKEAEAQGDWSVRRNRELQTLLHPEHLGRAFKVLVQTRQVAAELTDK